MATSLASNKILSISVGTGPLTKVHNAKAEPFSNYPIIVNHYPPRDHLATSDGGWMKMTNAKQPGRKTEISADQNTNCVTLASHHFTTNTDKFNSSM